MRERILKQDVFVAKLDIASDSDSGDRGFESRRTQQKAPCGPEDPQGCFISAGEDPQGCFISAGEDPQGNQ